MDQPDLDALEQDVESARVRLAEDMTRWRDPAAMSEFKDTVVRKATSIKDEVVREASDTATHTAEEPLVRYTAAGEGQSVGGASNRGGLDLAPRTPPADFKRSHWVRSRQPVANGPILRTVSISDGRGRIRRNGKRVGWNSQSQNTRNGASTQGVRPKRHLHGRKRRSVEQNN